ncbi:MAG: TetR/AcrR family transcriptional regulator [Muribaculaceae bacterium]|nr:TetR/AcrR family transcriptional regulator [Muribaculaceae bacterium]
MRTGGDKTHQRLIEDALKLFTNLPYDKVTFNVLERTTGLSRGAILYHVENKEQLFREAVALFIFQSNRLANLPESERATLRSTIDNFMTHCAEEQTYWAERGVPNISFARVTIEMSSFSVCPDSLAKSTEHYRNECASWHEAILRAVDSGEIRRVDTETFSRIFADLCLGASYAAISSPTGLDVEQLRRQLLGVYYAIAK